MVVDPSAINEVRHSVDSDGEVAIRSRQTELALATCGIDNDLPILLGRGLGRRFLLTTHRGWIDL